MEKQDRVARIMRSIPARIGIFTLFVLLAGGFTFWALRARADLAAAYESQAALAQQTGELRTAGSLNDLYDKSWLADERNFVELAGYIDRLSHLASSPSLDPAFKQELSDYIVKNQSRLPAEAAQIEALSFSDGILRHDQSRLLDMYDQLGFIFQSLQGLITYWDVGIPEDRAERVFAIQDAFVAARLEFQATTSSHRKILKYAGQLGTQSQQDSATGQGRVRADRKQIALATAGLIASLLLGAGWIVLVKRGENRE